MKLVAAKIIATNPKTIAIVPEITLVKNKIIINTTIDNLIILSACPIFCFIHDSFEKVIK